MSLLLNQKSIRRLFHKALSSFPLWEFIVQYPWQFFRSRLSVSGHEGGTGSAFKTVVLNYLLPSVTKLGQGYVFASVWFCSQRGGGGSEADHPRHPPPQEQTPRPGDPQEQILPQDQAHPPPRSRHDPPRTRHPPPPEQCMQGDTVNKRAVRILLE